MPEDLPDHLAVRDGGDDPQRPPLTQRAARHVQRKYPLQQLRPAPARRPGAGLSLVHTLLAWRRDDGAAQVAVRRQTARHSAPGGRAAAAPTPRASPGVPTARAESQSSRQTTGA